LELRRIDLYLRYDQPLSRAELERFKALIRKRVQKEPVAYIVGTKEFWSLELFVTKDVLIPRPETECVVEAIIQYLTAESNSVSKRILELGTGSGAIILACASQQPGHFYFASDCHLKILELARKNISHVNLDGSIYLFAGDWFTPLKPVGCLFDVVISNPPYVQSGLIEQLQPEIYKHEPCLALDGGQDGLVCLRHIIGQAHHYLKENGHLFLEIGYDQKEGVRKIIDDCGRYRNISFKKDYGGFYRVVEMEKRERKAG
jgi:release factor glutamine methyltransferase